MSSLRAMLLASTLLAVGILSACGGKSGGGKSGGGGGDAAQVQGSWYAALTSTSIPGGQGEVNLFIRQTGKTISTSPVQAYGPWCLQGGGEMSGTVNGNNVALTIHIGTEVDLKLTGTVSNGVLTGTYTATASCGNDDAGTFTAQLSPAVTSNSWAGTASFASGSADFTANLSESSSSGEVTGSMTFSSGSPCGMTVNLGGAHLGRVVSMTDVNGIMIDFTGLLDPSGKTISGEQGWGSESACGFEALAMSRP